MPIPKHYTLDEVAEITRAPRSSVCHWIYTNKLRSKRVGKRRLISERDLATFLGETEDNPSTSTPGLKLDSSRRRR